MIFLNKAERIPMNRSLRVAGSGALIRKKLVYLIHKKSLSYLHNSSGYAKNLHYSCALSRTPITKLWITRTPSHHLPRPLPYYRSTASHRSPLLITSPTSHMFSNAGLLDASKSLSSSRSFSNASLFDASKSRYTSLSSRDPLLDLTWVSHFVDEFEVTPEERSALIGFLQSFFAEILGANTKSSSSDLGRINSLCAKPLFTAELKVKVSYRQHVFDILKKAQHKSMSASDLQSLPSKIERLTLSFDDKYLFKEQPGLMELLIKSGLPSAKEYLEAKLKADRPASDSPISSKNSSISGKKGKKVKQKKVKRSKLTEEEQAILNSFDQFTLEWLIIHALCTLFAKNASVRSATLIDRLDSLVRLHASEQGLKSSISYTKGFGRVLSEFMLERGLISFSPETEEVVSKDPRAGYFQRAINYFTCNIGADNLPVRLQLPMVCPPRNWHIEKKDSSLSISDLSGGYLNADLNCINVQTGDLENFYLSFDNNNNNSLDSAQSLCHTMNSLQGVGFNVNSGYLSYILSNKEKLVQKGLLMPAFLVRLNLKELSSVLRRFYLSAHPRFSYPKVYGIFKTNIERARYEVTVLDIASAFVGYTFYLPAFLDFRGRIYRPGYLHFHERDLSRSLICFGDQSLDSLSPSDLSFSIERYKISCAFHYKAFPSYSTALEFAKEDLSNIANSLAVSPANTNIDSLLDFSSGAKHPFQFLGHVFRLSQLQLNSSELPQALAQVCKQPITQDASASAYQIISYLLLDEDMAVQTNLISTSPSSDIKDIYISIMDKLKAYISRNYLSQYNLNENNTSEESRESHLIGAFSEKLTRKLVKSIYMPLVYGKTPQSTALDIEAQLKAVLPLNPQESQFLTKICFAFWKDAYPHITRLMDLIKSVGWFCSSSKLGVLYTTPTFCTFQNYMKRDSYEISVYDRLISKKRRVTLRIPSKVNYDSRKTATSTFVNFVHQKDAYIAMCVISTMSQRGLPVYTVHDNFIAPPVYSSEIPAIYTAVFADLGNPRLFIDHFIKSNLSRILALKVDADKDEVHRLLNELGKPTLTDSILDEIFDYLTQDLKKQGKASWKTYIGKFKKAYESYTSRVTEEKWKTFEEKLRRHGGPYAVHC